MDLRIEDSLPKNGFCFHKRWALKCLLLAALFAPFLDAARADENELWAALRDGSAFGMMRHALAPGFSDPETFKIDDCTTQRNLSDEGRRQAEEIGRRFHSRGIKKAAVFSSAWCRCRETAELLSLGTVTTLEPLNSVFRNSERRGPQTSALKDWLSANTFAAPLILVTHQVNISTLTGKYTDSGDIIVVRREKNGEMNFLGKL